MATFLKHLDGATLFSYITTCKAHYEAALLPSFWQDFDHHVFQEALFHTALYESFELVNLLLNCNRVVDRHLIWVMEYIFAKDHVLEGMDIMGFYTGKGFGDLVNSIIVCIKEERDFQTINTTFSKITRDFKPYILARDIVNNLEKGEMFWLFDNSSPYLLENIAGALSYHKRYDELVECMQRELRKIKTQTGLYYFGIPFYYQIIKWADYEFYISFDEETLIRMENLYPIDDTFVEDEKIFQRLIDTNPDWINHSVAQATLIYDDKEKILSLADEHGYDYLASVINNS